MANENSVSTDIETVRVDLETKTYKDEDATCSLSRFLKQNLFLLLTLFGIILGFVIGLSVREVDPSDDALLWLGMPGELYLRMLKSIVLPLVVCSVITGTADTDPKSNGRISLLTFGYIVSTNALGALMGVAVYLIANPGPDTASTDAKAPETRNLKTVDIFADFIRNLFPDNIVAATMQQAQTKYITGGEITQELNVSGVLVNISSVELSRSLGTVGSTNLIGLIVICSAFGVAASQRGQTAAPFINFFKATNDIIFQLFGWLKWSTPVGVASLIARNLAGVSDLDSALNLIGIFVAAVCAGNLVYQFGIMPLLYFLLTRKNPFVFLRLTIKPWLISFGPASVALALPDMFDICENKMKIDTRVARFFLPSGATLNKDGSACFITATCLFIAAYSGETVGAGLVVTVTIISFFSSLAIPSIPSSSIVTVLVILNSFGIPPVNIGFVLAVEFITDRIRTTANLVSTMCGCCVVSKFCEGKLDHDDVGDRTIGDISIKETIKL